MELTFLRQEVAKLKSIVGESPHQLHAPTGNHEESSKESESSEEEQVTELS